MKALVLTWEFPPLISGGLGMACYGLYKSLLEQGVQADLVLPTTEAIYFPLRQPEDADTLPHAYLGDKAQVKPKVEKTGALVERLRLLGVSLNPESYLTPGFHFERSLAWLAGTREADLFRMTLAGDGNLFKKVQEYTAHVVASFSRWPCDVIHAHDWLTYPAGVLLQGLLKKPLVVHIHATEFDRAGGPGDGRIHHIEYTGLEKADRVIAVSQYTAGMVMSRYQIDPAKIRVVHNAYSLPEHAVSRWKLFRDPVVLFMGRVTLQKGPDYFLEVAQRVIAQFPKVRFVMAGRGDMFSRILKSSAAKRLKDRFLLTDFLDREEVARILSATDIFLLPSVSEPFGIVPLEAMAYGAAAIVSKQSGVSEVIQNAFKVDFWDVEKTAEIVLRLLKNPEEREAMAFAGKKEVMAIGWKEAAEKTRQIFRELS